MFKTDFKSYDKDYFQKLISESTSISEILRKLGVSDYGSNHSRLSEFLKNSDFDTTTLVGRKFKRCNDKEVPIHFLSEILVKDRKLNTNSLRKRLIKEGVFENKCEKCGIETWMGEKIVFELHHINGDSTDNRLENLILLCPNCHSQTSNFRGKNSTIDIDCLEIAKQTAESKKTIILKRDEERKEKRLNNSRQNIKTEKKIKEKRYCKVCGKELPNNRLAFCSFECELKHNRRNIPTKEELLKESFNHKSLESLSKVYNVSSNACKKWLKRYMIFDEVKNNFKPIAYAIYQFDLDGNFIKEWTSASEIESKHGYKINDIQKACNGHSKTSNGFIWKYKKNHN
jgi:hypothetical protein